MSSENKNETTSETHPVFGNPEVTNMLKTLFSQLSQPEETRRVRIREDQLRDERLRDERLPTRENSAEDDLCSSTDSEDLSQSQKMRIFADLAFAHRELCRTFSRLCEEEEESSEDDEDEDDEDDE